MTQNDYFKVLVYFNNQFPQLRRVGLPELYELAHEIEIYEAHALRAKCEELYPKLPNLSFKINAI